VKKKNKIKKQLKRYKLHITFEDNKKVTWTTNATNKEEAKKNVYQYIREDQIIKKTIIEEI